jgi:hypothetical protein
MRTATEFPFRLAKAESDRLRFVIAALEVATMPRSNLAALTLGELR